VIFYYLQQEEELVSAWWKEYAECSEGPLGSRAKEQQTSSADDTTTKVKDWEHPAAASATDVKTKKLNGPEQLYENDEIIGVLVKGGLYEVSFYHFHSFLFVYLSYLLIFIAY
jgi:hypothetical protein